MVQPGDDAGLSIQTLAELRRAGKTLGNDFERDDAPEARVDGAVHLSHAARAERGENLVRP